MDLYKIDGLKKISISVILEAFEDDIIICPYCGEIIDKTYGMGEFTNDKGYKSLECNHCFKITAVKFYRE